MDDSIRTAKYYAPNYTVLPTRQCLVCGTLENYSVSMTAVDESLPWLCDRCRETLLKLINDSNATSNASNALNALEQENKEGKEELTDRNVGKWIPVTERLPEDGIFVLVCNDDGHMMIAKHETETYEWYYKYTNYDFDIWDNEEQGPVRYWMPLPQPPKEE